MKHFIVLAGLMLAALAAPAQAFGSGRSLMQGTTSSCPVSPDTTTLDLSEVKTSCVAPPAGTTLTSAQCDQCSCALFSAFAPAFEQLGLLNSSAADGNSNDAIEQGITAVTACVTDFLPAFVAQQVNIQALVALGNCTYGDGEVPACLVQRVEALTSNSTSSDSTDTDVELPTAGGTAPAPDVNASAGPGDYTPDSNLNKDVQGAINNPGGAATTPTTTPTTQAGATPTPVPTPDATPAPAPVPSPVPLSASKLLPSGLMAAALLLAAVIL